MCPERCVCQFGLVLGIFDITPRVPVLNTAHCDQKSCVSKHMTELNW